MINIINLFGIATRGIITVPGWPDQITEQLQLKYCSKRSANKGYLFLPGSSVAVLAYLSILSGCAQFNMQMYSKAHQTKGPLYQHGSYCCWWSNYICLASLLVSIRLYHVDFLWFVSHPLFALSKEFDLTDVLIAGPAWHFKISQVLESSVANRCVGKCLQSMKFHLFFSMSC